MSTSNNPQSAKPDRAANNGSAAELSNDALKTLTGYFDVLIQMDFAIKHKERMSDERGSTPANSAVSSKKLPKETLGRNKKRHKKGTKKAD